MEHVNAIAMMDIMLLQTLFVTNVMIIVKLVMTEDHLTYQNAMHAQKDTIYYQMEHAHVKQHLLLYLVKILVILVFQALAQNVLKEHF